MINMNYEHSAFKRYFIQTKFLHILYPYTVGGPFYKFCSVTNFISTVVEDANWVIIFIDFTYDVMFMKLQTTLMFVLVVILQTCPKITVFIARQCMQFCNLPPTYPCVKGRRQLSARHFTRISPFFVMFHYKHLQSIWQGEVYCANYTNGNIS